LDRAEKPDGSGAGEIGTRKREILYGDFITEAAYLLADAFDHSLDRPETLVNSIGD
jgi:hypothetical protein